MQLNDLAIQSQACNATLTQEEQGLLLRQTDQDIVRSSALSSVLLVVGVAIFWSVIVVPEPRLMEFKLLTSALVVGLVLRVVALLTLSTSFYDRSPERWRWFFFSSVVLSGMAWGLLVADLIWIFGLAWQASIYAVATVGVGAGALLNFCVWKKLALVQIFNLLVPMVCVYGMMESEVAYPAIAAGLLYGVFLWSQANYWNARYWSSLINFQLLKNTTQNLQASNRHLYASANTDALTGLANRARLDEQFDHLHSVYQRYQSVYSVVMVDLDYFKLINDRYGHHMGDEVLCFAASHIEKGVRESDMAGRWGGEEFLLLLPESDAEGAFRLAESLRLKLRGASYAEVGMVTASFGVAVVRPKDKVDDLLKRADRALYLAKQSGRDRVCLADEHDSPSGMGFKQNRA